MGDRPSRPNPDQVRARRPRRRAVTFLLASAGLFGMLVAAGSAFAIVTIRHVEAGITKLTVGGDADVPNGPPSSLPHVDPICVRKACNFLVLGSDSRAGLPKSFGSTENSPGQRSDTIIVVQVDATKDRTVVLSIPRDLLVDIPGHGRGKINTALNDKNGRDLIVQVVEKLTGLHINHFVQIDFLGFQKLVDALGGVGVCIDRPMVDQLAGLHLTSKGCYNLKGKQSLAFVRARHIEGDIIPDFSRISRQQQFMRALIEKALSVGSLFRLPDLIHAVQNNLTIDENLNVYALQDLTAKLAQYGQRRVTFRIVPATPVQIDGVDYVELVQPDASTLFERIRQGLSLGSIGSEAPGTPLSPANISVQVLDAGAPEQVDQVVTFLKKAGFLVLPVKPAPSGLTESAILWGRNGQKPKETVSSYLPAFNVTFDDTNTRGEVVLVVVGRNFPGIDSG